MERTVIFTKLQSLISDVLAVPEEKIHENSSFVDLDADSMDIVNLVMRIEDEFNIEEIDDEDIQEMQTVRRVVDYLVVMLRNQ